MKLIAKVEKQMREAAANLNFEQAAELQRQDDRTEEKSGRTGSVRRIRHLDIYSKILKSGIAEQ